MRQGMARGTHLSVRTDRERRVHRLVPSGELDIATAGMLRAAFEAVLTEDGDAEMIVVDLTELAFIDSTGLRLLLELSAECEQGDRLRIINGSPAVERLLDIAGVRSCLPLITRDDDALTRIHMPDARRPPSE
jgi:anti-anti-sigma factor